MIGIPEWDRRWPGFSAPFDSNHAAKGGGALNSGVIKKRVVCAEKPAQIFFWEKIFVTAEVLLKIVHDRGVPIWPAPVAPQPLLNNKRAAGIGADAVRNRTRE